MSDDNVLVFRRQGVAEFVCTGCGVTVIRWSDDAEAKCATCQWLPGWQNDPRLRELFDPDNQRRSP